MLVQVSENLEPMGILIIFLIFIYRLKFKVKRLKMALTLDKRVEIVLLRGRQGWTQRQVAGEFNARHPERNPITQRSGETGEEILRNRICRRQSSSWSPFCR
jgi:hypothetical protein